MKRTQKPAETRVTLELLAPDAKSVFVAGTFNNWKSDEIELTASPDGVWKVVVPVAPGEHQYKFIIDGQWCCSLGEGDHCAQRADRVRNEHGTFNCLVHVGEEQG